MSECSCSKCIKLCRHSPGWMTPDEARKAIAAGFAKKLMLDYWIRAEGNIYILGPAVQGREADRAPNTDELFGDLPIFSFLICLEYQLQAKEFAHSLKMIVVGFIQVGSNPNNVVKFAGVFQMKVRTIPLWGRNGIIQKPKRSSEHGWLSFNWMKTF